MLKNHTACRHARYPPPSAALLLVGNARALPWPNVYHALRRNLVESYGAFSAIFAYIKVESEREKPGTSLRTDANWTATDVHRALDALSKAGVPIVRSVVRNTTKSEHPSKCPAHPSSPAHAKHYAGQMEAHWEGYRMLTRHERQTGLEFDVVVKARPDLMWLQPVQPWCSFERTTAYLAHEQPADWFFMLPRKAAARTLHTPYEAYLHCKSPDDLLSITVECCGGGPTAMVVAGAMQHGGPVIGTPWPTSQRFAWRPPNPLSRERKGMFACLVVRTSETDNEVCRPNLYFYVSEAKCTCSHDTSVSGSIRVRSTRCVMTQAASAQR
jgi:hypothetical protein